MQAFFLGLAARGFTRTRIPEEASGPLLCGLREVLLVFVYALYEGSVKVQEV
jgi:hypothetical protein